MGDSMDRYAQDRADSGVGRIHGRQGKVPQKGHPSYSPAYERGYAEGLREYEDQTSRNSAARGPR